MGRMMRSTFNDDNSKTLNNNNMNIGDVVGTDAMPFKAYGERYDNVHLFMDEKSAELGAGCLAGLRLLRTGHQPYKLLVLTRDFDVRSIPCKHRTQFEQE